MPETLVRSEADLLRTLVDHVSAMLAYWDSTLRCRFANRAYERWFGVSPEALLGKHISELLGPLYPLNLPYIEGALRGEPQEFEREIPNPAGGAPRHSLAHYIPDVVDGVVRGFFVLVSDISEVKRAQLALRDSEELFRLTIDEAPIGMALVALDGRFTRVNRVLCELLGYSREELTGLTFQAITHPEDLDKDLAFTAQLARGEIPRYQLEKRYIRKDGSTLHILLSRSALRGRDGAPGQYVAQIQDITERKRAESEQRFLAEVGAVLGASLDCEETLATAAELSVQEHADLCIVELLQEGDEIRRLKVASHDRAKAELCASLAEQPLDRRRPYLLRQVFETARPLLMPCVSSDVLASFAQSEAHLGLLKAAEIRSLLVVPLVTRAELLGAIAWISSSQSRTYGPSDVRLAEELARRAAQAMSKARLYRAAQRATQARDDILGIVAHDLRNPLNVILQAALLGQRGAESQRRPIDPAQTIERAARRMNRLIEDLLDVTRIDAGRLSVEPEPLSTAGVLSEAVEAQRSLAAAASLQLQLQLPSDLPDVEADHDRLLQVFENLIGNALKFTKGGGTISVGAKAGAHDVLFWIRDTGEGIDSQQLPHLFDRFWQARRSERRGAGLGLPIVKGIVEAHGGRIWVESAPGEGTTFFFTLPAVRPRLALVSG